MFIRDVHPMVKIPTAFLLTAIVLLLRRPESLAVIILILAFTGICGGLRPSARICGGAALMLFSFSLINLAFGTEPIAILGNLLRLTTIFLIGPVFTLTTSPAMLVRTLRQSPIPSGMAIALLITWRFIPALLCEARQIREAARLRGLKFTPGQIRLAFRSLIIPLCFQSLSFADHTALALEVRGFSLEHSPTYMPELKPGAKTGVRLPDICFIALTVVLPIVILTAEKMP